MLLWSQARLLQFCLRSLMTALTERTEHPNQPLRQHAVERGYEVVRLNSHVEETTYHIYNIVRVYGSEHKVTGKG